MTICSVNTTTITYDTICRSCGAEIVDPFLVTTTQISCIHVVPLHSHYAKWFLQWENHPISISFPSWVNAIALKNIWCISSFDCHYFLIPIDGLYRVIPIYYCYGSINIIWSLAWIATIRYGRLFVLLRFSVYIIYPCMILPIIVSAMLIFIQMYSQSNAHYLWPINTISLLLIITSCSSQVDYSTISKENPYIVAICHSQTLHL